MFKTKAHAFVKYVLQPYEYSATARLFFKNIHRYSVEHSTADGIGAAASLVPRAFAQAMLHKRPPALRAAAELYFAYSPKHWRKIC